MRWLLASIVSGLCFSAVALGVFLPLRDGARVEYLFVAPTGWQLAGALAVVTSIVVAGYLEVVRRSKDLGAEFSNRARSGRWLAPLGLLAAVPLGVVPAVPGVGERTAFLSYYLYDLRWWWAAGSILWVIVRAHPLVGSPFTRLRQSIRGWPSPLRLLFLDSLLIAGVMFGAAATTPHLRFDATLAGDEPKYMRYCEVWYQGLGLNVLNRPLLKDLPIDAESHVLRNVGHFARSVAEETRALVTDLRGFFSDPLGFQWNRARSEKGFVWGKRGGLYQIYLPGLSVFLLPGYYLDRHFLATHVGSNGEFPSDLVASNLTILVLFGCCAIALFRLLRHVLHSEALAAFWAAIGMMTMPTAAFAFQFYPEISALLCVLLAMIYIVAHGRSARWPTAAAAGACAAALAWFHPRFLPLSVSLILAAMIRTPSSRHRLAILGGAAIVYLSVGAHAYRVTGSWLPNALWSAPGSEQTLDLRVAPVGVLGYALHSMWGAAPHAPLLLAALPGIAVIAREARVMAVLLLVLPLALVVPAAAHTLHAAGTTPGRLIVAVVPLMIWPVAVLARRFWRSPVVRTLAIVAVALSLETAVAYNRTHDQIWGSLRSPGTSGWRPNLAFPVVAGEGWQDSRANVALLVLFLSLLALAAAAAFRATPGERDTDAESSAVRRTVLIPAVTVCMLILLSGAATAFNGIWTSKDYFTNDARARQVAAETLVERDQCRVCFSTTSRAVDWSWLQPNNSEMVYMESRIQEHTVALRLILGGAGEGLRFGRARVDFGDGSVSQVVGIVGSRELVHTYPAPGTYDVAVWLQLRDGQIRGDRHRVTVRGTR